MIARCCVAAIAAVQGADKPTGHTVVVCSCRQEWRLGRRGVDVWLMHPQQTTKPPGWVDHVLESTRLNAHQATDAQLADWLSVGRDIHVLVAGIVKLLYGETRRRSVV